LLVDPDPEVRTKARSWLESSEFEADADYTAHLGAAATHPDRRTRTFAVQSLHTARVPAEDAVLILKKATGDPATEVRAAAAEQAGHYAADARLVAPLIDLLADPDPDVRRR
jgi:HEAT repeat protein